ncbi:Mitochondrial inner membrane protease subunit 1 [Leucoagaricus sp. SymC.cos]|nr:Mitochondrial inner membrane protease subunit 1 [Leucoagaricus sp. SymC.cos]
MEGPSMFPTLADSGELVIEDRLTLLLFPDRIARGDLVVLKSPIMPQRTVCKRVLGLPGDIVCVDPTGDKAPSTEHIMVPKGHIWISGDNAPYSRDSRDYGPVSMSLLQGKLLMRVSGRYCTMTCVCPDSEARYGHFGTSDYSVTR